MLETCYMLLIIILIMQKYIICLTYKACRYEIFDFFNVIGTEPMYGGVAFEPCLLFTAIASAIALYLEDALVHSG